MIEEDADGVDQEKAVGGEMEHFPRCCLSGYQCRQKGKDVSPYKSQEDRFPIAIPSVSQRNVRDAAISFGSRVEERQQDGAADSSQCVAAEGTGTSRRRSALCVAADQL